VTSPADTIRQAATLMRQRAQAATPGPWISQKFFHSGDLVAYNIESRHPDHMGHVGSVEDLPDLIYVASWHPIVALAIAESWEQQANDMADAEAYLSSQPIFRNGAFAVITEDDGIRHDWTATLAAARAYLGETTEAGQK
jgi:hypothetical protein